MGLFDSYFDPQTFSGEGSGPFSGLLALQQEQAQYQPAVGFTQTPLMPQTPSPAATALSAPADSGQTLNIGIGGYQMPQFGRADVPPPAMQPPGFGDRLGAGFQSWAHTPVGNPFAALANGVAGFGSGQRTDQAGLTAPQTSLPAPHLGDRLSAGFQNWTHTPIGNPFAAIANGITGLDSGLRIANPATSQQTAQARLAALKSLLGPDAAPEATDNPIGPPATPAQALPPPNSVNRPPSRPATPAMPGAPAMPKKPSRRLVGVRL
jgi:hypothetical protein